MKPLLLLGSGTQSLSASSRTWKIALEGFRASPRPRVEGMRQEKTRYGLEVGRLYVPLEPQEP